MDVFSRTFLPAAAETGVAIPTVSRHMPIFRRCVAPDDVTVLVTRCVRPDRPLHGDFLLVLTHQRLVVTHETRVLHKLRLHLNTELQHLSHITWNADPRLGAVEFAATAVDGVRERFHIRVSQPKQVWHIDALFSHAFRPRLRGHRPVPALTAAAPFPAPAPSHQPAPLPAVAPSRQPASLPAAASSRQPAPLPAVVPSHQAAPLPGGARPTEVFAAIAAR